MARLAPSTDSGEGPGIGRKSEDTTQNLHIFAVDESQIRDGPAEVISDHKETSPGKKRLIPDPFRFFNMK